MNSEVGTTFKCPERFIDVWLVFVEMLPTESHPGEGLRMVTTEKSLSWFIVQLDGHAGTSAWLQKYHDRIGREELDRAGTIQTCCSFYLATSTVEGRGRAGGGRGSGDFPERRNNSITYTVKGTCVSQTTPFPFPLSLRHTIHHCVSLSKTPKPTSTPALYYFLHQHPPSCRQMYLSTKVNCL